MKTCPVCKQKTPEKIFQRDQEGKLRFHKENWRSLFRIDPLITLLTIIIILSSLLYMRDTAVARHITEDPVSYCQNVTAYYNNIIRNEEGPGLEWNKTKDEPIILA